MYPYLGEKSLRASSRPSELFVGGGAGFDGLTGKSSSSLSEAETWAAGTAPWHKFKRGDHRNFTDFAC